MFKKIRIMSLICTIAFAMSMVLTPVSAMAIENNDEEGENVVYLEVEPRTYFLSDSQIFDYSTEFTFVIPSDCKIESFKAIGTVNGTAVSNAVVNIKLYVPYASVYQVPLDGKYHTFNTATLTNRTITLEVRVDDNSVEYVNEPVRLAIILNDSN